MLTPVISSLMATTSSPLQSPARRGRGGGGVEGDEDGVARLVDDGEVGPRVGVDGAGDQGMAGAEGRRRP
ncbi:MAG: hypothetical protein U0802_14570 [Candidatus Binatia bacterium]